MFIPVFIFKIFLMVILINQVKIRTNLTIIDGLGQAWVAVGLARQIGGENFSFFVRIFYFFL